MQARRARKAEHRRLGAHSQQFCFSGSSHRSFGDFIGHVYLQAVMFGQRVIQGPLGIEFVQQVRTQPCWQVGGFHTKRREVGDAHASQKEHFFRRAQVQRFRHVAIRVKALEGQHL